MGDWYFEPDGFFNPFLPPKPAPQYYLVYVDCEADCTLYVYLPDRFFSSQNGVEYLDSEKLRAEGFAGAVAVTGGVKVRASVEPWRGGYARYEIVRDDDKAPAGLVGPTYSRWQRFKAWLALQVFA